MASLSSSSLGSFISLAMSVVISRNLMFTDECDAIEELRAEEGKGFSFFSTLPTLSDFGLTNSRMNFVSEHTKRNDIRARDGKACINDGNMVFFSKLHPDMSYHLPSMGRFGYNRLQEIIKSILQIIAGLIEITLERRIKDFFYRFHERLLHFEGKFESCLLYCYFSDTSATMRVLQCFWTGP